MQQFHKFITWPNVVHLDVLFDAQGIRIIQSNI